MIRAEIDAAAARIRLNREVKVCRNELIIAFQPFRSVDNLTLHKNVSNSYLGFSRSRDFMLISIKILFSL